MLIVIGVILLLSLVILHELGHFWAARRAGIEVEEFGLGFPPRAKVLAEKNGTKYTLNWLPLGGFVKLKGEHDSDTTPGSFGAASLLAKVQVMVAGVIMNYLTAIVLISIIAIAGLPQVIDNQFSVASDAKVGRQEVVLSYVEEGSPAANGGIEVGDVVFGVSKTEDFCPGCQSTDHAGDKLVVVKDDLTAATESFAGEKVFVHVSRDGQDLSREVQLRTKKEVTESKKTDTPKGYLGVAPADYTELKATWSAPIVGFMVTNQFIGETMKGLFRTVGDLFTGNAAQASEQVTGVVGIGSILGDASDQGFMQVLLLTALISLSLAVMNVLPIPALDGGRLFVTLLFRVLKRPLKKETEERIHGTGFALLMLLFVLITILDVKRFIIN